MPGQCGDMEMPVTASLCADSVQSGVVACHMINDFLYIITLIKKVVDTDLPDINVVKRTSFSAGQTVEGGEVIPEHPEYCFNR